MIYHPKYGLCFGFVVARLFLGVLAATTFSKDVSNCPGYNLHSLQENSTGLVAHLSLAGSPCNAFGNDFDNLTIQVTYETESRLHVRIADSDDKQFTIPESVISLPPPPTTSFSNSSDLVFNYDPSPFAFWITRRSNPEATPLFDTRLSSLPKTPIPPVIADDNSTTLNGFPLVFEDQYLQLTSSLPLDTNIYGLGEVIASSGFRRNVASNGGSIQTLWARDVADPIDQNMYGNHPIYLEHRFDESTNEAQSHGVFSFSSSGADILLLTPPGANQSLVQYRMIGGILNFYFFSGPSPHNVIEQYGELVGLPSWIPSWGFGFHLCRWGYVNVNETMEQVQAMRAANIPLEVMWNDIDLYHAFRDFTSDPVSFPGDEVRAFIQELASNNQHYIPILDAALAHTTNDTDVYDPYTRGHELGTFVKNPDGSEYIGQVWPGYTVFPDWFANSTQQWWTEALKNWSDGGVEYSGIWLDMNEISSFCQGSCGSGADLGNTTVPFFLPGTPESPVTDYPECYDPSVSGPSGNITVNGALTCINNSSLSTLAKRGLGAGGEPGVNLNTPPYAIHNAIGDLSINTLATNATHAGGYVELDVHNMWGMMEEKATHLALQELQPGKRPVIIARSTFPSSGKWAGHWLGDNFSKWEYLYYNIQGILQFQIFQIPFVGADTCGFNGNTDEELCNRWMQLSAFVPFYRNHNEKGALSQEPYRWASVANASRTAIATRYSLLPYWMTLFANVSTRGTPPVRALWYEFPTEPELFAVDKQFLVGADLLVTPVLTPNVSSVDGIFPGRGQVTWRDFYTHAVVNASNGTATLSAPLGHINAHIRGGAALLLHAKPGYTTTETRAGPFALVVSLESNSHAFGTAYLDDGITNPPSESRTVAFSATANQLQISSNGNFTVEQKLEQITVLGVSEKPSTVSVGGETLQGSDWEFISDLQKLVVSGIAVDLNGAKTVASW
jgi:alpha-glucosidase